jgi:hypothetical protein
MDAESAPQIFCRRLNANLRGWIVGAANFFASTAADTLVTSTNRRDVMNSRRHAFAWYCLKPTLAVLLLTMSCAVLAEMRFRLRNAMQLYKQGRP